MPMLTFISDNVYIYADINSIVTDQYTSQYILRSVLTDQISKNECDVHSTHL